MERVQLVLLPGMVSDRAVWQPQIDKLADIAECHVPDYGTLDSISSMATFVLERAPPRFVLAGHSMGGRVALEMYRLASHRIIKLGLFGTAYERREVGLEGEQETARQNRMIECADRHGMRAMGGDWVKRVVLPERLADPYLVEMIVSMVERKTPAVLRAQICAGLNRPDQSSVLDEIQCSTLLVCGRQDAVRPLNKHQQMKARIRDSSLVVVENCGHMAMLERPHEVTGAMKEWLTA